MTRRIAALCVPFMLASVCFAQDAESEHAQEEKDAVAAAEAWLALVDGGKYNDSWEESASYFKGRVGKGEWRRMVSGVRKPLGAVASRELSQARYASMLPGAPDGEYVVIRFETSFDNKANAVETVTPMKDKDGSWRVSGYFVN